MCASFLSSFFSCRCPCIALLLCMRFLRFCTCTHVSIVFADSDCLEIPMPHMSSLLSCIMSDGLLCTFAASHGLLRSLCHMSYNLSSCLAGYTLHPPISSPCSLYCIIMHVISCRLLRCSSCVLDDAVTFSALLQSFLLTQKVIRILGPLAEKAGGTTRRV